jgi:predicted RNase H-like nuclease (RuvC/YqgF family)
VDYSQQTQKIEPRIENGSDSREKLFSAFENKLDSLKSELEILRYDHDALESELECAREAIRGLTDLPKKHRALSSRIDSLEGDLLHKIDGRMGRKMEILKGDIFKEVKANLNKDRTLSITGKVTGEFCLV